MQRPYLYFPLQQHYSPRMTVLARTGHGRSIAAELRRLVTHGTPELTILSAQPLTEVTALALVPQRVAAYVSGVLGIVGLLLTSIGIYGVTAYAVSRRTREIAIRLALGAQRRIILRMVLLQGMSLIGTGVAIGSSIGAAVSRLLRSLLFGVPPLHPAIFGGAIFLVAAVGLLACYVPMRRATRIDAMAALRFD